MKTKFFVTIALVILASTSVYAYVYGQEDLNRAHQMKDRGDFREARDLFRKIGQQYSFSYNRFIVTEGSYFSGYCSIKLNDYWKAAGEFQLFLDKFDNGYWTDFVPDAIYALGRTYEAINNSPQAEYFYRECIKRFPNSDFAEKSRARLRGFGEIGEDNFYSVESSSSSVVSPVPEMKTFSEADLETKAIKIAKEDFFEFLKKNENDYARVEIKRTRCVPDGPAGGQLNQLRVIFDMHVTLEPKDKKHVVRADYIVNKVDITIVRRILMTAVEIDPFVAFNVDQGRIDRVNAFIGSVKNLDGVEKALSHLSDKDKNLEVVQENLNLFSRKQKFEELHQVK